LRIQDQMLRFDATGSNENSGTNLCVLLCKNHAPVIRVREAKTGNLSSDRCVICAPNHYVGCGIHICLENGEIMERVKGVNLHWK